MCFIVRRTAHYVTRAPCISRSCKCHLRQDVFIAPGMDHRGIYAKAVLVHAVFEFP
jgi:hypothetical protein